MSRSFARNFQTATRTLVQFVGSPIDDLVTKNGANGHQWRNSAQLICNAIEGVDPRIAFADIQGAMAHKSSKDKDDTQDVITVGLQTKSGTRIGAVHIHLDGSWKFFASRAGREGGYAANIQKANLPGYIASEKSP